MPVLNLSTKFVETVPTPPDRIEYYDTQAKGLALRVSKGGRKTWVVLYRNDDGTKRRLTLGDFPSTTLDAARKKANSTRGKVADGADPVAEKRHVKQAQQGITVGELAIEYIAKYAKVKKKTWQEDQRMLDAEILTAWKDMRVADLTRPVIRSLVEGIAQRAPVSANRYLSLISKMLNFAIQHDHLQANPAARMGKPGAETSRERILNHDEIRAFWQACETERPAMRDLTRLRLLTAQRGVELETMRWDDLDLEHNLWVIPKTVAKNKVSHHVPLAARALAILAGIPKIDGIDYVFPGRIGNGAANLPCSDARKACLRIAQAAKIANVWGRDLRRTASTNMAAADVPGAIIAKVLNHKEQNLPASTPVYNRYAYDKEKRAALVAWDKALTAILKKKTTPHA